MRHSLLNKYLAGETTANEEQELRRLLICMPQSQLTEDEQTVLHLLTYADEQQEDEDLFAVDYTKEYDKVVRPARPLRLWPFVAAACVAGALFLLLTPPKEEDLQPEGEQQLAQALPDPTPTVLITEEEPAAKEEEPTMPLPHSVPQPKAKPLIAETHIPITPTEEEVNDEQDASEPAVAQPDENVQLAALEEADEEPSENYIITHPERLEYTPEELEVLKQRAKEKYLEWIQLEQEILEADKRRTASMK